MESTTQLKTDWSKCCLCQVEKSEKLSSPFHALRRRQDYQGYSRIAENIPAFHALHSMPIPFNPARLDEGGGIENTLVQNKAKYHQSCKLMFNTTKLQRAQKRVSPVTDESKADNVRCKRRRLSGGPKLFECCICEKEDDLSNMRQAMTMHLNERLHQCAKILNDGNLLAKLSAGDAVALELKYHAGCLTALYNRERTHSSSTKQESCEERGEDLFPIAFSELVIYINERKVANDGSDPVIFRLADLVSLYKQRLRQLGVLIPEVNSTRLKEQLLAQVPELEAYKQGRDVLLAFKKDVSSVLHDVSKYSQAVHLAKAAAIIRKEMLNHKMKCDAKFGKDCGVESIPQLLLQFVCSIEHGADIKSHLKHGVVKSDLSLAQLLQYNCFNKSRDSRIQRHSKNRETPFVIYTGMTVFAKTRKRQLIDKLHENGISISYDRVMEISAQLGESVITHYVEDDVVCPPILRKGLFTTSAVDNIDHNPTATTATSSFHGTSISIFQHPNSDNKGEERSQPNVGNSKMKKVPELPESFISIPPAFLQNKNPAPPDPPTDFGVQCSGNFDRHLKAEYDWLEKVLKATDVDDSLTWSAYHSKKKENTDFEVSISSLLPLLRDPAHSIATVKHVMDKIKETVMFLNPGQTPVLAADQPLYAIAKQIQWTWREKYGENKFVIMFGGLHIEMAALRAIGSLLEDSGWTSALVEAGVAFSGTAESFLSAGNVTRTRKAHQITACCLYQLMKKTYEAYIEEHSDSEEKSPSFSQWCEYRQKDSPLFQFWFLILRMELTILTFIRSLREGDFELYLESLSALIPYFFANNNVNYARWLPIHLQDMMNLEKDHPEIAKEFRKGNFVVRKSKRKYSAMAIDQAHEQNNAVVKGDGGAIGLTEDPQALRRWMVAGPEISRLLTNYEASSTSKESRRVDEHHEQSFSTQKRFFDNIKRLAEVMEEMGNPFEEDVSELLTIDTKDIADPTMTQLIATHYERGKEQFISFITKLREDNAAFYQPIKRNKISYFKHETNHVNKSKARLLKDDRNLFSRLFISCQTRQYDLNEFFSHENQTFPAALSTNGDLRTSTKSDLVNLLQSKVTTPEIKPQTDVLLIDGSGLVNALPPRTSKTFDDYAKQDILPKVLQHSSNHKRTDIVFDVYHETSLKSETRSKRGKAIRRRVSATTKTPSNWRKFLRDNRNKTELFHFLAEKICNTLTDNPVLATRGQNVISSSNHDYMNTEGLQPCTQEEADSRLFLHAYHAAMEGHKSVFIDANDTDIVVIAVSLLPSLTAIGLERMWVTFGKGEHTRWIPIHDLVSILGPEKTNGMLFFHAFTGCDVVSFFNGKGKKTAWQTWNVCGPETSDVFAKLSQHPSAIEDDDLQTLERFVVLLYDRSNEASSVNEARLELFARKQRTYDSIPPSRGALVEHVKRAAYQAGHVWYQALVKQPQQSSPSEWGWRWSSDGHWKVYWTSLEPIAKCCQELTSCGCKVECQRRCKCYSFGLDCSLLCNCVCMD